ncbi:ROK family protein [Paenibacillus sp. N3/727]|uniref:ROK family protein n=1 Tax=Paenibacillus sp. N3/727 TaxID=2925845 RepID=UPI001F53660A|nr:ROK family protein [Paenibacillus sp. N3/727]UNK18874.1 ROK family protein [Paenibacillus sp. N3/727]
MRSGDGPDFGTGAPAGKPAEITLALDAGGTVLKGALLVNGQFVPGTFITRPSASQGPASDTIASFADACYELLNFYTSAYGPLDKNERVRIGFAFPGPFDYAGGIALLQGVGKYEALYKLSVRDLLRAEFQRLKSASADTMIDALASANIRFGNDAFMFGLGVSLRFPLERLICLTLGTGLGSAFVDKGYLVSGKGGIPLNGMLFAEPYRDRIVDDYFGRRGILKMASERGILTEKNDVADLAEEAKNGNTEAADLFNEYGRRLGEMLLPYATAFKPNRIVLGGQISRSFPLWEKDIQQTLGTFSVPILQLQDGMIDVFRGIHKLFEGTDKQPSASIHK